MDEKSTKEEKESKTNEKAEDSKEDAKESKKKVKEDEDSDKEDEESEEESSSEESSEAAEDSKEEPKEEKKEKKQEPDESKPAKKEKKSEKAAEPEHKKSEKKADEDGKPTTDSKQTDDGKKQADNSKKKKSVEKKQTKDEEPAKKKPTSLKEGPATWKKGKIDVAVDLIATRANLTFELDHAGQKQRHVMPWNVIAAVQLMPKQDTVIRVISCCLLDSEPGPRTKKRRKDFLFSFSSKEEAASWISLMLPLVVPNGTKRFAVFVNPYSGKKQALKIWYAAAEILEAAGCNLNVTVTQHRMHALEEVRDHLDISKYQGIICVSGDGLVWEVLNGIMERKDWQTAIKLPIGIIPAGTGNAMSSSIGAYSDPLSATLNLIKGYTAPLDTWRIFQEDKISWAFLQLTWGIVADVDIQSEKFRMLGDLRYDIGGIAGILTLKKYKGKIHYLASDATVQSPETDKKKKKKKEESQKTLNPPTIIQHKDPTQPPSSWTTLDDEFTYMVATNASHLSTDLIAAPKASFNDGYIDLIVSRTSVAPLGKMEMIKLFDQMKTGEYIKHKAIESFQVKAFTIEPGSVSNKPEKSGVLSIDGERVKYTPTTVECVPSMATIFVQPPING